MLRRLANFFFYILCVLAVIMAVPRAAWLFELFTHFGAQFAAAALAGIAFMLWYGRFMRAGILALAALYIGWPLLVIALAEPIGSDTGTEGIKIMHLNLNHENLNYASAVPVIRNADPHVISFNEINPVMMKLLKAELQDYPYVLDASAADHKGMAVFSKIRSENAELWHLGGDSPAVVRLDFPSTEFTLVAVHALSPMSRAWASQRDQLMTFVSERLRGITGSVVMAGDLNATVHTPVFTDFVRSSGLGDASHGYGWQPTWYADSPLALVIDYILYRGNILVNRYEVLADVGSDHRPIMATVTIN